VKTALIEGHNGKQGHLVVTHTVEAVGGNVAVRWLRWQRGLLCTTTQGLALRWSR
jgi:hypothetical protein